MTDNTDRPAAADGPLPLPDITPLFTELLKQEAARRGLPPEPWAVPPAS